MPIYEYGCEKCGHQTEMLRPMAGADEPVACESCGQPMRRLQSVFSAAGGASLPITGPSSSPPGPGDCGPGCGCMMP